MLRIELPVLLRVRACCAYTPVPPMVVRDTAGHTPPVPPMGRREEHAAHATLRTMVGRRGGGAGTTHHTTRVGTVYIQPFLQDSPPRSRVH